VSLGEALGAITATGELMMKLLASVSQWERQVIGEHSRDTLAHLKAQGKRYAHTVYDTPEGVPQALTQARFPTALGGAWQAMVVHGIIKRTRTTEGRQIA
jgi:hypothetical protein